MEKMDPLLKSLVSTVLCVGGPLTLFIAHRLRPDWFVGKLKLVQWLTTIFMAIMILTLAGGFLLDRQQPPKPARVVPALPPITKPAARVVTPPQQEMTTEEKAEFKRFLEIGDKK